MQADHLEQLSGFPKAKYLIWSVLFQILVPVDELQSEFEPIDLPSLLRLDGMKTA